MKYNEWKGRERNVRNRTFRTTRVPFHFLPFRVPTICVASLEQVGVAVPVDDDNYASLHPHLLLLRDQLRRESRGGGGQTTAIQMACESHMI